MKQLSFIVVATALVVAPLGARRQSAPSAEEWSALTTRLETASLAGDVAAVKDARIVCLRLLASPLPPERQALVRYTVAYAGWRLAFAPALSAKEQADLLDDAELQLDAAIKLQPKFAEALGLLSSVYGIKIAKTPDLGMTLGPRSGEVLGDAFAIEPDNPRLLVLRGGSQLNTPPEYGGSAKDAGVSLRRALELFSREPVTKPWPNWGRFDAHVGLGQTLAALGDKAGARAEYELALTIAPKSAYVRNVLLPAVK